MTTPRWPVSMPVLAGNEKRYVDDALDSGWISSAGSYGPRFERAVGEYLGLGDGLAVANGTVALHLACRALGLGEGMDVIVPSLTYVATANAVSYCGARVVPAESDPLTWNISASSVASAWTPRTVGVIAVHLYGLPAPVDALSRLCHDRGAWLIEDCAEAFAARIGDRFIGSFGDLAAFSFFANKIISTGEGGMVFAKSPEHRARAALLRGQAMDPGRRYWHTEVGYNYRLTNVASAIGVGQMEMVDYHVAERRRIGRRYIRNLTPLAGRGIVQLPVDPPEMTNVFWLFSLIVCHATPAQRDAIANELMTTHGIETRPFFTPMHQLPMYRSDDALFPVATRLAGSGLNLPTYSGLSDEDIDHISGAIVDTIERNI